VTSNTPEPENNDTTKKSPNWNWTTKLVIGLTLVALAIWLLVQFQNFLGPILSAVILAYLMYPIAEFLQRKLKLPWRLSATLIYIILVLLIVGLLTWGGFALVDQIQNLIDFIENNIDKLPDLVDELTGQSYQIGPFTFSPSGFDWEQIANEFVSAIQPLLGRLGSFASAIAAGAVNILTWLVLILLVSYFLLSESEGIPGQLLNIKIPGYNYDLNQLSGELKRIWNAFMRGEVIVVFFSWIIYTIMLGVLGVQFFYGLAAIAAFGQLIPYLGAWITWISFGLVALLQTKIPFGIEPWIYMIVVLAVAIVINNIIDNILRTKVMASNLKVHPAVVLIGALIGLQLFGFIGIIIAAPVMATFKLLLDYVIKKLNDQDPWIDLEKTEQVERKKWITVMKEGWEKIKTWFGKLWQKITPHLKKVTKKTSGDEQTAPTGQEETPRD
jgi:predicted PurR-regulated permease PerM